MLQRSVVWSGITRPFYVLQNVIVELSLGGQSQRGQSIAGRRYEAFDLPICIAAAR